MIALEMVTRGWDLPGWEGDFYPADLPFDWRLTYFANEFPAVLVAGGDWVRMDEPSLRAWFEDVPEGFRFYLQDPGAAADPRRWALARHALGTKLAGLVAQAGAAVPRIVDRFEILGQADSVPGAGSLPAWRVPGACVRDPRAARAWLESLRTRAAGGRGLLVLGDDDARAEDLRCWWHLLRLMGVA